MFRKSPQTFPKYDTSYNGEGKRHAIDNGLPKRCNEIMKFLRGLFYHHYPQCKGVRASVAELRDIVVYMKGVDPSYTRADIVYAVGKLEREGFIVSEFWGCYMLRHDPREVSITFKKPR